MLDVGPAPSRAGPVSTAPVKIIGTDTDTDTDTSTGPAATSGKTKRYPSTLPSSEDCIPQPQLAYDNRDWRVLSAKDVSFLSDNSAEAREALAFARTIPVLTREDLDFEQSGVHEVGLRLALDPRDGAPDREPLTPTLRVKPSNQPSLTRAWQSWEQQSPLIAIGTAATFCFIAALLVSVLAP